MTPEVFETFMKDGFAVIRGAVDRATIDDINARIGRFKQRNPKATARNRDEHGRLYRVVNLHVAVDAITRLLTESAAIALCDRFFGEPTSLYTSLYYERGSEQALHRDTPLFATTPGERYLGVWTALDEVADDNGPLKVVRGSHLLPPVDVAALRARLGDGPVAPMSDDGWRLYQEAVAAQCTAAGLQAEPVHVSPGDVIVWHPQLFHGGAPHPAPRTRRSVVMHVTPRGTPIGHMDVFYQPERAAPGPGWSYYRRGDRHVARFKHVDFGHEYKVHRFWLRKA